MRTITAIEGQKRKKERVNIFLDGTFALSLSLRVVAEAGLKPSVELTESQVDELRKTDDFYSALETALGYLSPRPRSQREIHQRLRRGPWNEETIEQTLCHLERIGLVDDAAFAQFWKENRTSFNPRSRRLLEMELRQKGVDTQIASDVAQELDDEVGAYQAGQRKARTLGKVDYPTFQRQLAEYLRRRGFHYEVIRHSVHRLWEKRNK
ncbi:MAG: RecX family transcriptional regulator [Chloroflexi bacterium]|nr:RecX family transcriptional regulator [Chloroflexota bacterium]